VRARSGSSEYFSRSHRGLVHVSQATFKGGWIAHLSGYKNERATNVNPIGIWMIFETRQAMLNGEVWKDMP
jgi:hypothetical protein